MFCECRDIVVCRGRSVVLDVKRLTLAAGRITAIAGPNGAGKTTLLEVMALLRRPTRGQLRLWDTSANVGDRSLRRKVVMVMHPGYLFRGDVWENLTYGMKGRGIGRKEAEIRARDALSMVGLGSFAHRDVAELSAGERQRVNLARAIAIHPSAILLDEPTANVDLQTVAVIRDLLGRLRSEHQTTIVYTSPAESQLHEITDRVVELTAGQVRKDSDGTC